MFLRTAQSTKVFCIHLVDHVHNYFPYATYMVWSQFVDWQQDGTTAANVNSYNSM